jgi:hypothetical protein
MDALSTMSEEQSESISPIPPEEKLTLPSGVPIKETSEEEDPEEKAWLVVARNRKVNKSWEILIKQSPENARRCYEWLCAQPMQRLSGRIFPLKGKIYNGAWEYEVTGGSRIYYVPDPQTRKVVVYYAGPHPKKAPTPP